MDNNIDNIKIEESWKRVLKEEFNKPYFKEIKDYLIKERNEWKKIYPEGKNIFNAFNSTPFDKVKVVILWQDPYHWQWQAHWLCFSVLPWIKSPPSLKNIFKELESDLWIIKTKENGCLQKRAEQWVFMLNTSLTVREHEPMSHAKIGREIFTDEVIKKLSQQKEWIIFLLRWAFAQWKKNIIDTNRHYILETTHPSPFSAHRWFLGSKPFSKTNIILKKINKEPINRNL